MKRCGQRKGPPPPLGGPAGSCQRGFTLVGCYVRCTCMWCGVAVEVAYCVRCNKEEPCMFKLEGGGVEERCDVCVGGRQVISGVLMRHWSGEKLCG